MTHPVDRSQVPGAALDIRALVAVDAVARTRSFKLAADLLNTSQPTLSRLISSAEATLGVALFERGWSGAETTSEGDVAARFCSYVVAALEAAQATLFEGRSQRLSLCTNLRSAQLDVVEAICRHGSVTHAARALGRAQPDLSRTLSDFSKRFDLALFSRCASGMTALPAARHLAELAGTIAYYQSQMRDQLRQLETDLVGRVSVGLLPFSSQDVVLRTFGALTRDYPNLRLVAVPGSYNSLLDALRRREIDRIIGITRGPDLPPGLLEEPLFDEQFAVIARCDHPLHSAPNDPDALARTHWIVAPHGTPVRRHFETVFSGLGLTPPTQTCELLSFGTAEQMLINSPSVAMLTYAPRKLNALRPELCEVATGFERRAAPIALTRLADVPQSTALAAFDSRLRAEIAAIENAPETAT